MTDLKIIFSDASEKDLRISDLQADEFKRWLRFANQRDEFILPSLPLAIKRKSIARTVFTRDDDKS